MLPFLPMGLAAAGLFVVLLNAALGVISVARATLPLSLFGRRGFAVMLGQLTVPQNIAFAAAPLLFAVLIERLGADRTLLVSAAIQFLGFFAMLALVRVLSRGNGASAPAGQ